MGLTAAPSLSDIGRGGERSKTGLRINLRATVIASRMEAMDEPYWEKMMNLRKVLWIAGGTMSLACAEDVGSENVRTQGMYANYEAVAEGDGSTQITAELRVGGDNGTFVELGAEDELFAITADDDIQLRHTSTGNQHRYKASLPDDAEDLEIQIAFSRGEDFDDAVESWAKMPAPFEAELDDADVDSYARGEDVSIVWDNEASGSMQWHVDGDCVQIASGSTDDDGTLTIDGGEIEVWESDAGENCEVTVTLERQRQGSVDPTFEEGGDFRAIQRRTVSFLSTPGEGE